MSIVGIDIMGIGIVSIFESIDRLDRVWIQTILLVVNIILGIVAVFLFVRLIKKSKSSGITDIDVRIKRIKRINKLHLVLICIIGLSIFLNLYNLGLQPFNTDETTYTAQSAIWAGHDEYRQNFIPYSRSATNFQVHQLITSIFFRIFGINEFVARLPVAIMGVISIFLVYLLACELFTQRMAILSALFIGLNGYSLHINREVNLDTSLVTFVILTILFIVKWRKTKKNWYFYLFLISIILTTISKVIIIFPLVAIIFTYLYIEKDYIEAIKMLFKPISVLIILVALSYVIYFITSIIGVNEFIKTLLYASGRSSKVVSNFYLKVMILLLGYIFLIITIIGIIKAFRYRTEGDILCIIWFSFMLIFFTYYPLQGYNYIFPIIPPMSLLNGRVIDDYIGGNGGNRSGKNITFAILPMILLLSMYPVLNVLDSPDKIVESIAPVRFDNIRYTVLKDASLWMKNNTGSNSKMAVYSFADTHVIAYYSGLKTYTISNFPGYYMPTDNNAKISWDNINVMKMIEDGEINYVVYMEEPVLSRSLKKLYEEGVDIKLIYSKKYKTPKWYSTGNLNISIFEVHSEKPIRMDRINDSYFTIVVLPDTQTYSKERPDIFKKQVEWIAENIDNLNIKFVINTGSMVDSGKSVAQWNNIDTGMNILEGKVPYLIVPGDHDYNGDAAFRDRINFNTYFNYSKFEINGWYGGHYPPDGNENNYGLFSSEDKDFLLLGIDYCPTDDELEWANEIIDLYPNRKIIIFTHSYLNDIGERISFGKAGSCSNNGVQGNEGEDIWNKLIKRHQNIILVLSGHKFGVSQKVDYIDNHTINQILQNYQTVLNGGNGYLRLYTFVSGANTINVDTYSPYTDEYDMTLENRFSLSYE